MEGGGHSGVTTPRLVCDEASKPGLFPKRALVPVSVVARALLTATLLVAFLVGCEAENEAAEVSGRREVVRLSEPEPTPTIDQAVANSLVAWGPASEVPHARSLAPLIRPILRDATYRPGWLVWVDWNGLVVGLDLEPDSDQAFAFDTGITNLVSSAITPAGVILVDGNRPDTELFVEWSGQTHRATSWLVDSDGAVVALNGDSIRNLTTGENLSVDGEWVPPGILSARGPYIESKGETFEWTWEDGLERVGPGGVAAWSIAPKPGVVLRDLCEPDDSPCPLAALSPGDQSRQGRASVEAPDHEAGGYAMAPDRHAAAARGQSGWELVSVDDDSIVLDQPSQAWWVSTSTAHWGAKSELLAVVAEELTLYDGRDGTNLGAIALPEAMAELAFVDLDSSTAPGADTPMPAESQGEEEEADGAPIEIPTPSQTQVSVSFLEQEPDDVAEAFRLVGVKQGWVVARLGEQFVAVDVASGESQTTTLSSPTAPYVVTPFGVATLDDSDRLVLFGWDGAEPNSIVLSDALPRSEGAQELAVHRDTDGSEMTVLTSGEQTVAVTLGPEQVVKTLTTSPMVGDWPFSGSTGPGPLVMPFAGRPKAYSWDAGWVPMTYDRVLLSGVRYFVADTCRAIPGDCLRQLVDRENQFEPHDIDTALDPVAVSPDESAIVLRRKGAPNMAVVVDTATAEIIAEFAIDDEILAMLSDDLVLTLGDTYTLHSVELQQPVLQSRTGSMVAVLDELAPLEDFSGEFFPQQRPGR